MHIYKEIDQTKIETRQLPQVVSKYNLLESSVQIKMQTVAICSCLAHSLIQSIAITKMPAK